MIDRRDIQFLQKGDVVHTRKDGKVISIRLFYNVRWNHKFSPAQYLIPVLFMGAKGYIGPHNVKSYYLRKELKDMLRDREADEK